jgi:hypothetical protein
MNMIAILHANNARNPTSPIFRFADAGLLLIFYSLYYGCLNRDFAEIATNRMAATIGV